MDERQPGGPVGQPAADAGEPRLPAPGPPELIELARRSPEELASRLAHVSIRDQARLALQLPTTERLQLLLHAPRPTRLLRALPDTDLYLTVRDLESVNGVTVNGIRIPPGPVVIDLDAELRIDTFRVEVTVGDD